MKDVYIVKTGLMNKKEIQIEGDASAQSYPLAFAKLTKLNTNIEKKINNFFMLYYLKFGVFMLPNGIIVIEKNIFSSGSKSTSS